MSEREQKCRICQITDHQSILAQRRLNEANLYIPGQAMDGFFMKQKLGFAHYLQLFAMRELQVVSCYFINNEGK